MHGQKNIKLCEMSFM